MSEFKYFNLKKNLEKIQILYDNKEYGKALKEIENLLGKFPCVPRLLLLKGALIQLLDDEESLRLWKLKNARESLELAIEIDPNSIEALNDIAFFIYAVEDNSKEALNFFERSISLCRDFLEKAYEGKIECLLELGKRDEALACLKETLRIFPDSQKLTQLEEVRGEMGSVEWGQTSQDLGRPWGRPWGQTSKTELS